MTSSSENDWADSPLLELFREEARSHAEALNKGLLALEQNPEDGTLLEGLMRAAHSIKGAARVVNVQAAVPLAHALESCLVAAQQGQVRIEPSDIDLLLQAADILAQIGEQAGPRFPEWLASEEEQLSQVQHQLEALGQGQRANPSKSPPTTGPGPKPATEDTSREPPEEEEEKVDETEVEPDPALAPMLNLFREEVQTHTETLKHGLSALELSPQDATLLEALMRAARSIKGAARVVKVQAAVPLATALESYLTSAQQGRVDIDASHLQHLLAATDLLAQIGASLEADYRRWLRDHQSALDIQVQVLEGLTSGSTTPEPDPVDEPLHAPVRKSAETRPATEVVLSPYPAALMAEAAAPQTTLVETKLAAPRQRPLELPPEPSASDVVRVSAQSLTRLMGLAGESLVEARWLEPFSNELLRLKKYQGLLADVLDQLLQPGSATGIDQQTLLNEARQHLGDCQGALADRIAEFETHARQANDLNSRLYREVIASRMRPFTDGVHGFPRMVRDVARQLGKRVRFEILGEQTEVDRDILEKLEAPLNHLLRNALDHGIEPPEDRLAAGKPEVAQLRLEAGHAAGMLSIQVSDDGRGIDLGRLRRKVVERGLTTGDMAGSLSDAELLEFLFLPGFSTAESITDVSGRGVGLDVVHHVVHSVGGSAFIRTRLGQGTSFHLHLPVTLSVIRAVLVEIDSEPYAFPHNRIDRLLRLRRQDITSLENRQYFTFDGRNVGLVLAAQVFDLEPGQPDEDELCVVMFSDRHSEVGLIVDDFWGEQDLVVRPLDPRLGKVPNISSAALLDDGSPVLIVDLEDLTRSIDKILHGGTLQRAGEGVASSAEKKKRILVVDDSITVREVQRQMLGNRGYEVETAVDGMDGWNVLRGGQFDLVISDIDMPRMGGLDFVRLIRQDRRWETVPIIIVSYKDRSEDRVRGLEVGANYYLTKSSFHDESLLHAVEDLIGPPCSS